LPDRGALDCLGQCAADPTPVGDSGAGVQSRVSSRTSPGCSSRCCSVGAIRPSAQSWPASCGCSTLPVARYVVRSVRARNPSPCAVSTSRRSASRVSRTRRTSPSRRCRNQLNGTGNDTMPGSGGIAGHSAAVSQPRAGAVTRPSTSRAGRNVTTLGPGSSEPVRNFGPARSITIRHGRPVTSTAWRTLRAIRCQARASSWAQLILARFIPRLISRWSRPGSWAAAEGKVTMMRVWRPIGTGPSNSSVRRANQRALSSGRTRVAGSARPGRPDNACTAASTACTVAATCGSLRPNEDNPNPARRGCNSRKSCCRMAQ
jgi:hypothetical protein